MDKIIDSFKNIKRANNKLENNNYIKIRCEYKKNNKDLNAFIYLDKYEELINIYKVIDKDFNGYKHFYEVIEDKCKFFLDLDVKCKNMLNEEWNKNINLIKEELKALFKEKFDKDIKIIEYQSFPSLLEQKFSCHLIVPNYCFYANDCKNICNMLLTQIKNQSLNNMIDDKVYGKKRMLRIEGSTKLNSDRKKKLIYEKDENKEFIKLDGLITNLKNTKLLTTNNYYEDEKINYVSKNKNIKKLILKENDKKYDYTNEDIDIIKKNIIKIISTINNWHLENNNKNTYINIFELDHIINNMAILKRIMPYECPECKRIHESQNPYIFISNKKLFFHCRRSLNPVNIIINNDNIFKT